MSEREYNAGTVEHGASESSLFAADGKKSGHGTIAWLPAPSYEMPVMPPWPPAQRPPVIALLDSGVQQHAWLPPDDQPRFLLKAEDYGWQPPVLGDDTDDGYGSHWGHATFIAGLIRLAAPSAQVLSMRIMNSHGKIREQHAVDALNWLADHSGSAGGVDVDIVLLAFGRLDEPAEPDLDQLRAAIAKLAGRGVRIVASAGNDGTEHPVYPAAFAVEPSLAGSVISVGALATTVDRAPYSNVGPWVTQWRQGTNIVSIMPLTTKSSEEPAPGFSSTDAPGPGNGYAWWSGTSFAAATVAGQVAGQLAAGLTPPLPTTRLTLPQSASGS